MLFSCNMKGCLKLVLLLLLFAWAMDPIGSIAVTKLFDASATHQHAYFVKINKAVLQKNTFCRQISATPVKTNLPRYPSHVNVEVGFNKGGSSVFRELISEKLQNYRFPGRLERLMPADTALASAQQTEPAELPAFNSTSIARDHLQEDDAPATGT